jgi:hypothetical protein
VQLTETLIGLVIYYVYVAAIGKWCRSKNISRALAFRVGAAACLLLALGTIIVASIYFGRIMLINDDPFITAGCILAIALLGGLRCRDQIPKEFSAET